MILRPKNWSDFQHYKNRSPPWVRLHKRLLDDRVFQRLPVASRALAPMLWLLASESEDLETGQFDGSVEELAFRLRLPEKEIEAAVKPLIQHGFFEVVQDASNALATCLQRAVPEERRDRGDTETETDSETEKSQKVVARKPAQPTTAGSVAWSGYADAYQLRYSEPPVRNKKANSLMKQLVERLGSDEAPLVAAFYVSHNSQFYVSRGHAVEHLVKDAEKLRTEWVTGRTMTTTIARQTDQADSNPFLRMLKNGEGNAKAP